MSITQELLTTHGYRIARKEQHGVVLVADNSNVEIKLFATNQCPVAREEFLKQKQLHKLVKSLNFKTLFVPTPMYFKETTLTLDDETEDRSCQIVRERIQSVNRDSDKHVHAYMSQPDHHDSDSNNIYLGVTQLTEIVGQSNLEHQVEEFSILLKAAKKAELVDDNYSLQWLIGKQGLDVVSYVQLVRDADDKVYLPSQDKTIFGKIFWQIN